MYDLYTAQNTYFVTYSIHENNLLIYSHGGLSHSLVSKGTNILDIMYDCFNVEKNEIMVKKLQDYNYLKVKGHYNGSIDRIYDGDICYQIDSINNYFRQKLFISCQSCQTINSKKPADVPGQNELFLLAISSPFSPEKFSKNVNFTEKVNRDYLSINFTENTPIMPGIVDMKKYAVVSNKCRIIQIIGHVPKGYSATVDLYSDGKNDYYVVNMDISQTLMNDVAKINHT